MRSSQSCSLLGLPLEVFRQVATHVPPPSHLDLAVTCADIHRCCVPTLQQHSAAHAKYQVVSDLLPETVPELLRNSVSSGFDLWHVLELEFWGSRNGWESWVAYVTDTSQDDDEKRSMDPLAWSYGAEEIAEYFAIAEQWWKIPESDLDLARDELQSGKDGFIKMLVIASSPRLRSIKFIKRGLDQHTSLQWLTKAIHWSRSSKKWAPGLQSLRYVSVGIVLGGPDEEQEQAIQRRAFDLAALLLLPNIRYIYFRDLSQSLHEDDEVEFNSELDDNSGAAIKYSLDDEASSVQHLYLDHVDYVTYEFRTAFLGTLKSLVSMTIRGSSGGADQLHDIDTLVSSLGGICPHSMTRLTLYNRDGLHGYRNDLYFPEELESYKNLRQISMSLRDVNLHIMGLWDPISTEQYVETIKKLFPSTLEVLMLWGEANEWLDGSVFDSIKKVEAAVIAMIESGYYKNLRVIYLDQTERDTIQSEKDQLDSGELPEVSKMLHFREAVEAGRKGNVHVHTLTNQDDTGFHVNFPATPDKYDIKSSPSGGRPSSWKVNRMTGDWEKPGCGGCGTCEDCLTLYSREVWSSLKSKQG